MMQVAIVGLGPKTGMALAKHYAPKAQIHVFDQRPPQQNEQRLQEIGIQNALCYQDQPLDQPLKLDQAIVSPGVPWDHPLLDWFQAQGIPVRSEIDVASSMLTCPMIAVTGSLGKSTVTQLLGEVLRQKYRHVFVGGNLGNPLIEAVDGQWDFAVVEVSSFQLEQSSQFHPQGAVLLNLHENHLDRHQTMDRYLQCKQKIYAHQTDDDWILSNADQPQLVEPTCAASHQTFSANGAPNSDIEIFEQGFVMNGQNIVWASRVLSKEAQMIAHWVANRYGIEADRCQHVIQRFRGLPHRCETVVSNLPCSFINDSKSTTPASTLYAVGQCTQPVHLLVGGRNKNMDVQMFMQQLAQHPNIRAIYMFGEVASLLSQYVDSKVGKPYDNLAEALHAACLKVQQGEVILLSPGFASFDRYENMAERGEHFKQLVQSLELF